MHYKFRYEERYIRYVDVEADTIEQAEERLEEAICNDEIEIDNNNDFSDSDKELVGEIERKFDDCDDYISAEPSELDNRIKESKKAEGEIVDSINDFVEGFFTVGR